MEGTGLVDHSGLGATSRLTATGMARGLAHVHGAGRLKPILKEIGLRDSNGRTNKAHPVKVMAKTGTLYFVSSLAGYMTAPNGRELSFAVFTADTARRAKIDTANTERPPGARGWNRRAKNLQQVFIERWGEAHGS